MSRTLMAQYGAAFSFEVHVAKAADGAIAAAGDYSILAGDWKRSKDESTEAALTATPIFVTGSDKIKIALDATEMSGKEITVKLKKGSVVSDDYWRIRTYGHPSASDPRGIKFRFLAASGTQNTVTAPAGGGISTVANAYIGMKWECVGGAGADIAFGQVVAFNESTRVFDLYVAGPPSKGRQSPVALTNTSIIELSAVPSQPAAIVVDGAGAINANALTVAVDAVSAAAVSAAAVTKIQAGLATAAALTTVNNLVDTEIADIQSRLPVALVSGKMDASVGALGTDSVSALAVSAAAVTKIQAGLATAAALNTVDDFVDTEIAALTTQVALILTKLPTALVGGRMDASTEAVAVGATAAIAIRIWDEIIEGAITARESQRLANAANAGKTDGFAAGIGTGHLRDLADTKNRVTAGYDANGNRTSVVRDLT